MRNGVTVRGGPEIRNRLRRELTTIQRDAQRAVYEGLNFWKALAVLKTPVEFGELRNSAFVRLEILATAVRGRVGFTKKYAPWVHEMPGTWKGILRKDKLGKKDSKGRPHRGSFWDPQGEAEPEFLRKAIDEGKPTILRILARYLRR